MALTVLGRAFQQGCPNTRNSDLFANQTSVFASEILAAWPKSALGQLGFASRSSSCGSEKKNWTPQFQSTGAAVEKLRQLHQPTFLSLAH